MNDGPFDSCVNDGSFKTFVSDGSSDIFLNDGSFKTFVNDGPVDIFLTDSLFKTFLNNGPFLSGTGPAGGDLYKERLGPRLRLGVVDRDSLNDKGALLLKAMN